MPTTLVKANISQAIGQSLIDDLYLQKSKYYYSIGRSQPWVGEIPPNAIDTERYEQVSRSNALYFKRIEGTSLSFVIPRIDYKSGITYDIYDDTIDLYLKNYYVLNSDFNVYKCLHNNGGAPSTVQPFGTSQNAVTYSDGYSWKFIYNLPPALRNKFLTASYMPVYNAITERYYSRGSINSVIVTSGGSGYTQAATTINVTGDGFLEFNPFKITEMLVNFGGSGYSTIPTVKTEDIFENNTQFIPTTPVILGQTLQVSDASGVRYYLVESAGMLGSIIPTHYYIVANSGTASLRHVGTEPKIDSTINANIVGSIFLTDGGFGYTVTPTITKNSPGTSAELIGLLQNGTVSGIKVVNGGTGYTNNLVNIDKPFSNSTLFVANTNVILNEILEFSGRFYQVTQAGQTGATGPTHDSGIAASGTSILLSVGRQATAVSVNGVVSSIQYFSDIEFVKVTSMGANYTTASVTFTGGNPVFPAVANAVISGGKIIRIIVTYPGYGYQTTPTAAIVGDGTGATLLPSMQFGYGYRKRPLLQFSDPTDINGINATGDTIVAKTNAIIEPVILGGVVRGINIVDAGVGYTSANLTVLGDGTGSTLTAVFASGDLTTIQSQSELFAVKGTLSSVKVESEGSNIQSINITIEGDGTDAIIEPVLLNGQLKQVKVISEGKNYTFMNLIVNAQPSEMVPVVRAILSPVKGHGSNPIKEFYTKSVALNGTFSTEINNGFAVDNDFRQVMIFKNPLQFNMTKLYEGKTGSSCVNITTEDVGFTMKQNTILTDRSTGGKYTVISFTANSLLLEYNGNYEVNSGDNFNYTINNTDYNVSVKSVTPPQIDKYSGEVLFIDNIKPFSPNENQAVTITTAINLV